MSAGISLADPPSLVMQTLLLQASPSMFVPPLPGPVQDWPLYISSLPEGADIPDKAAAIYDTEGKKDYRLLASKKNKFFYGIQIKVRALTYSVAYNKLIAVQNYLFPLSMQPITVVANSYLIDTIIQTSQILSMGQDERRRALASVNFMLLLVEPNT